MAPKEDSIIVDYFTITHEYQQQYGEKVILLMQVGAFFEVYGLKHPQNGNHEVTQIDAFSEMCDLVIAEKSFHLGNHSVASTTIFPPYPQFTKNTPSATVTKAIHKWLGEIPLSKVVMAGHSIIKLDAYVQKITDAGYTAVVYVQEKDDQDRVIQRKLYNVYSPGTMIGNDTDTANRLTNHITCIWLEKINTPLSCSASVSSEATVRETMVCGISNINIFTGESTLFEYQTPYYMNPTTFDELERNISTFAPSEVVIISEFPDDTISTIVKYAGISSQTTIHVLRIDTGSTATMTERIQKAINCTKQKYIHQVLSTFFGADVFDICSEFCANILATQSFCYLLNFIQEHNSDLVRNIHLPRFSNTSKRMVLANHTLKQLNILCDDSNDSKSARSLASVSTFLNRCCTSMGKRKFQYQLTNPVFDTEWLNQEYTIMDYVQTAFSQSKLVDLRKQLRLMKDVEKICRQLVTKRLVPSSIAHLYNTIHELYMLHTQELSSHPTLYNYLIPPSATSGENDTISTFLREFLEYVNSRFFLEHCSSVNSLTTFDQNIIKPGVCARLDAGLQTQSVLVQRMEDLYMHLNQWIKVQLGIKDDCVKIHDTDKSGKSFQITKKRGASLKKFLERQKSDAQPIEFISNGISYTIPWNGIQLVNASANYDKIVFPLLNDTTRQLLDMEGTLNPLMSEVYQTVLHDLEIAWYDHLEQFAKYISSWDVLVNKVYMANEYHYCRPRIVVGYNHDSGDSVLETSDACRVSLRDTPGNLSGSTLLPKRPEPSLENCRPRIENSSETKAFVQATGLRHCLIEHLQTNEIYVTNDLVLGDGNQDGVLLYGTNAVGKTSIIRALGIAVIMAQAGCYVPCSQFVYRPYTAIFSRILGNDNIFKGLSTFAVEMSELRLILKMADQDSLILGDELCSGTEIESALSIFLSGLMNLHEKRASFVFATHFHNILQFEEMTQLDRIHIKHMSVFYDRSKDCLVYDRLLKDGPGNRMYGLEVCKSLYLPTDFLEKAYEIRNKYYADTKSGLMAPTSHYNAKKIMGICEMCRETMGEEIHHLQYQESADKDGYIGHFHKNHPANLMSVCQTCHDKIHADDHIHIKGGSLSDSEDSESLLISPMTDEELPKKMVTKRRIVRKKTTKGYTIGNQGSPMTPPFLEKIL
jgi:DNA mismatch repair protein MutS